MTAQRFDVFLVAMDPTVGRDVKRTRRCVVVSPDEMNRHLKAVIVAPITSRGRAYPTRVPMVFQGQPSQVALDQLRTVDRDRLVRHLGRLTGATGDKVLSVLGELFGA